MPSLIFDRSSALARMGGDERLLREMMDYFLTDVESLLPGLQQAIRDQQCAEIERKAHTIKGLASNFGAPRAIRAAWTVEQLGHGGDHANAAAAMPELEAALAELKAALQAQ